MIGACFADVGHNVICVDNDQRKADSLRSGHIPIYEPGLEEVVHRNVSGRTIAIYEQHRRRCRSLSNSFIAVPTPPPSNGSVDLTYIEKVAREIADVLKEYRVIVDKSTVPVKTGEKVAETIPDITKPKLILMWLAIRSFSGKVALSPTS